MLVKNDALGRRIEKLNPNNTAERYYYDDQRVLLRTSVNSSGVESDSRTFVFGNYIDEVLIMRQPTGTEYLYGHDHLYSPAVLFDAAGTVVRRYEYDVYGRMRPYSAAWGSVPWPAWQILGNYYAFTGRELDRVGTSQTGFLEIMYYPARYYAPDTGRFLQPDLAEGIKLKIKKQE